MADEIKLPPLPEPNGAMEMECGFAPGGGVEIVWIDGYSTDQMTAHATAAERMGFMRGLEAAAKACDNKERRKWEILTQGGQFEGTGPLDCAAAIRSLASTQQGDK
jgi:hypothetical protein